VQGFGATLIVKTGAVASLQGPATAYLRIRSFAQPALLAIIVTQSSLLAQKDSWSPALAVTAQVVVNFTLDIVLIVFGGAGVAGAAWATVAAQYLGAVLLVQRLCSTGRVRFTSRLAEAWRQARPLALVLAPLVVVYVSRNLCYLLLQVCCRPVYDCWIEFHAW
jgi:MATE family multidrug resistance protein